MFYGGSAKHKNDRFRQNQPLLPQFPQQNLAQSQNDEEIQIFCPKHQEKIVQVQINEANEIKTECQKCLTKKEYKYSIQDLGQKIQTHRSNELQKLNTSSQNILKGLDDLIKCSKEVLDYVSQKINSLIGQIENSKKQLQEYTKKENDILTKQLQQLQLADLQKLTTEITFNTNQQQENFFGLEFNQLQQQLSQGYIELANYLSNQLNFGKLGTKLGYNQIGEMELPLMDEYDQQQFYKEINDG